MNSFLSLTEDSLSNPGPGADVDALADVLFNDAIVESDDNLESILNLEESDESQLEHNLESDENMSPSVPDGDVQLPNNDFCFTPEDFIETRAESNVATRHAGAYSKAWNDIKALIGETVESRSSKGNVQWTIVDAAEEDHFCQRRTAELLYFKEKFSPSVNGDIVFHNLDDLSIAFWKLWPGNVDLEVEKVNKIIDQQNHENKETYKRQYKQVSKSEFLVFHALLIAASIFAEKGDKLWEEDKAIKRRGISKSVNFGKWMKKWRFRQLKLFIPRLMESEELKVANDDWWQFKERVDDFNTNRRNNLYASHVLVFDESMSAYVPR